MFSVCLSLSLWKQSLPGRWLSVCHSVWTKCGIMGDGPLSTSLTNCLSVASARTCPSQWVISAKHGGKRYKPLHLSLYNVCDPYAELRAELYLCMSWAGFFLSCVNMLVWPWYWFYHYVIDGGFGREDRSWMFESVCAYVSAWEFQVCPTEGQLLVLLSAFCLSPFFLTCCTWISSACVQGSQRGEEHPSADRLIYLLESSCSPTT